MDTFERSFTGAKERIPTEQDVLLASFSPVATRTAVYLPKFYGVIEDQKKTPACGAHMGQSLKQILESFRGSPEYLWKKIKLIDGFPPSSGTDMLSIMKVLKKNGITSMALMPNNADQPLDSYTDPSTITPVMDQEASRHRIGPYAFTFNPTFEQLKQNIYDHKAVGMLLRVGAEWWRDPTNTFSTWNEDDILPLRTNIPITSGHFVTAYAYDEKYIYFVNEWSSAWGKGGLGYFGEDYMSRCVEIGTTVNLDAVKYVFLKTLKIGDRGFDSLQLQKFLNTQGFILTEDSAFGNLTELALKSFQTKHGLKSDGVAGQKTNAVINQIIG